MNRRTAALALAAVAVFGLAGCTASPGSTPAGSASATDAAGDGGQSTADACALVQDTITSATKEFDSASASDPGQVVDAMKAAAQQLSAVAPKVTNDEMAALLPAIQDVFQKTGDTMSAIVSGDLSKAGDMAEVGTSMQDAMQKFQTLCAS
jgi:hypothetical protein